MFIVEIVSIRILVTLLNKALFIGNCNLSIITVYCVHHLCVFVGRYHRQLFWLSNNS